jgi:secreted trypsin-like serine protease
VRFFAPLALLFAACQGALPEDESAQAIVGGTTDTGDPSVVMVLAQISSTMDSLCTGEVVSPHVILTAAHCVDPKTLGTTNPVFGVLTGTSPSPKSVPLAVQATHYNPMFNDSTPNGPGDGYDVGVVILAQPINLTPLIMNRTALDNTFAGQPVRMVGYGITSPNDTTGMSAGTKRQVTVSLAGLWSGNNMILEFVETTSGTCEGDSGGPAFMTINGREVIAGLTSFSITPNCMSKGYDSRVDLYIDWINQYINQYDPGFMNGGGGGGGDGGTGGTVNQPGPVGATCMGNSDCASGLCASQGSNMFCTAACDPSLPNACPNNTDCTKISAGNFCVPHHSGGGCSSVPNATGGGALLVLAFLALCAIRSSRRFARR